jgi:flagellar assembly protein FliH
MAAPYSKFSFDTEFFEVVAGGMPGTAARSPGQVQEELRQQAYAEGVAAGQAQGQAMAEGEVARLQAYITSMTAQLEGVLAERERTLLHQMLGFVRGTLQHVLGQAVKYYPDELLAHHLQTLVPLAKAGEALVLRINPQARGFHEKLGLPQANILGVPMQIVPDPALGLTDALLEWQHGGLESKAAQHVAWLNDLLTAAGAAAIAVPDVVYPPRAGAPIGVQAAPAPQAAAVEPLRAPAVDEAAQAALQASKDRAAALLGDDELVDALKT